MISHAMQVLTDILNFALQDRQRGDAPIVHMGRVTENRAGTDTSLILTLVNLSVDSTLATTTRSKISDTTTFRSTPPLSLGLSVLLSAKPGTDYAKSLELLSTVLHYLHTTPEMTAATHPTLEGKFEKIAIAPLSLALDELRELWALQSAPYQPSLAYEVRAHPTTDIIKRPQISTIPIRVDNPSH
jgi:hypothetical protein